MTDRKELAFLLSTSPYLDIVGGKDYGEAADDLITNGVTVQRWISAETPPKDRRDVLVSVFWHETWQTLPGWYAPNSKIWYVTTAAGDKTDLAVSHWREMPEPPKEVTR